jgi:hemerythrin-like domain-containing protein
VTERPFPDGLLAVAGSEIEAEGHELHAGTHGRARGHQADAPGPGKKDLDGIAEFLAVFVDKCHHGKEEEHLFPALERAGIPRERGPIGVMLFEHDQGRRIAAQLRKGFEGYRAKEKDAGERISKSSREYGALLTTHIEKENRVLFPMAEGRIGPDEDARLTAAFEALERERIGPGKHEAFHQMLSRLEGAYLQ